MARTLRLAYDMAINANKESFMLGEERITIKDKTIEDILKEQRLSAKSTIALTQLKAAFELINLRVQRDGIYVIKLIDDDCSFITSDNPVICYNLETHYDAPFHPENVFELPLDSKHRLVLMPTDIENGRNMIIRQNISGDRAYIKKMITNMEQSRNADKFILGSETDLKKYLKIKEFAEGPSNLMPNDEVVRRAKILEQS